MLYKVKPLKWVYHDLRHNGFEIYAVATTIFCDLRIEQEIGSETVVFSWCIDEVYNEGREEHGSVDEAVLSAGMWYWRQLLPALEKVLELNEIAQVADIVAGAEASPFIRECVSAMLRKAGGL